MPFIFGYKFREIQDYIAGGGRLLDVVAGSTIVDSLTRTRLISALCKLGLGGADEHGNARMLPAHGTVLQAGSGRILLLFNEPDPAHRFARLWPLLVEQSAPGARHAIDLRETGQDELAATIREVSEHVNNGPELALMAAPPANPLTLRERRTGLPVVQLWSGEDGVWEDQDGSSRRRAEMRRALGELSLRFGFGKDAEPSSEIDAIARAGGGDIVAVIHADGTLFGKRFGQLQSQTAVADFSVLLREVFIDAAKYSVAPFLTLHTDNQDQCKIAIRPLVLGGDDMTVLVPGRYGLTVATRFLERVEAASAERLPEFLERYPQPDPDRWERLQAGAGIAYVHAHFPFRLALHLADTCAAWAKARLKAALGDLAWETSCLQFHAALDSGSDEYGEVVTQQLQRFRGDKVTHELTAGPYVTRPAANFATIADLDTLRTVVDHMPRRGWREIARLAHELDDNLSARRFRRQLEIMDAAQRDALRQALERFGCRDSIWSKPPLSSKHPFQRTPVQDVDTLIGLERKLDPATAELEPTDA